jgi:hypothetical protein
MIDEERQAQALRTELDHELAAVRATAQARERLIRATAARTRAARSTRGRLRLRPILALPLAGALVATVIGAAVVVPTLLQSNTDTGVPAGGGGPVPGISTSPTPSGPTATAAQQSTQRPSPSAATKPTSAAASPVRATPSPLRLNLTPKSPELGQRVILTLLGVPAQHGGITVQWGDRSTDDTVPGSCGRRPRPSETGPLAHSYARAGTYRVTVTLDRCGTPDSAGLTVHVQPGSVPAPSR